MTAMRGTLARLLRGSGLLRFDLLSREQETHPSPADMRPGELVIVRDGGHAKWACMRCPCGCGADIKLSLNPSRRPRWSVERDWLWRPSVTPSVHRKEGCGSHFWVRCGRVDWCPGGRPGMGTQGAGQAPSRFPGTR